MNSVSSKRFAWLAALLCIGCCTAIPLLALLGIASAVGLAVYLEAAAAGFALLAFALLAFALIGYAFLKKRHVLKCGILCGCADKTSA